MSAENSTHCHEAPLLLEIDTSNICNLRCLTCMRGRGDHQQEKTEFLRLADFKTIIDKMPQLNTVQFCGSSETTLNRELPDMINYAKNHGAKKVEMFTNGTMLKGQVLKRLVNSKLDFLKVSVDGGNQETYKRVRGFDLTSVIRNVRQFHERSSIPIGIESVLSNYTVDSIGGLPDVVHSMGGSFLEIRLLNWVDPNMETNSIYNIPRLVKIREFMKKSCNKLKIQLAMPLPDETICNGCTTFTELYVDYRGNVSPCYFLNRTPIGNLIRDSFEDVWNGQNIKKYRQNFLEDKATPDCCCSRGLMINKRVKI
jgi:radical SAM protein with 4Fe4S-binding SPASM domain